jgi:hypothetical protein
VRIRVKVRDKVSVRVGLGLGLGPACVDNTLKSFFLEGYDEINRVVKLHRTPFVLVVNHL